MKFLFFIIANFVFIYCAGQSFSVTLPQKQIYHPSVDSIVDRWDKSFREYNALNSEAKQLFYWINYSRINPKRFWDSVLVPVLKVFPELKGDFTNSLFKDLYSLKNLPMFSLNESLCRMSQQHSDEIGKPGLPMSHDSPDGSTFDNRFKRYGLINCGGENISIADDQLLGLILLYIDYNLPSEGHRRNLLSLQFTQIGIGVCKYATTSSYFSVQDFACNQ